MTDAEDRRKRPIKYINSGKSGYRREGKCREIRVNIDRKTFNTNIFNKNVRYQSNKKNIRFANLEIIAKILLKKINKICISVFFQKIADFC